MGRDRYAQPLMRDDDVIGGLRALGLPAEAIARAMRRGDPEGAIFDAVLMPAIAERTVSASEIERRGGLRVGDLQAFISAFGLRPPGPDEPAFTAEEASALVELGRLGEVWPPELDVRLGRVWGPLLARIAQAGVQLFRLHVEPRLRADDADRLAGLRAVQETFARLLPLADPLLVGSTAGGSSMSSRRQRRQRRRSRLGRTRSPGRSVWRSCSAT